MLILPSMRDLCASIVCYRASQMPTEDATALHAEPTSPTAVERCYEMRLASRHVGDDNEMSELDFELRRLGEDWASFEPSVRSSPFLNFLHSALLCQLAYLRMNATERGLRLARVHGLCRCDTADFVIERFVASFAIELRGGEASHDDLAYLRERCLACPVSRNLVHVASKDTAVMLGSHPEPGRRC